MVFHLFVASPVPGPGPAAVGTSAEAGYACLDKGLCHDLQQFALCWCSLLGTWSDPGWDPVESTLLQVSLRGTTCADAHAGLLSTPASSPCSVWCWLAANALRPPSAAVVRAPPACLNAISFTWWCLSWSCCLQVLVSILSMVFVEEPYFNEPGASLNPLPQKWCFPGTGCAPPLHSQHQCALLCRLREKPEL